MKNLKKLIVCLGCLSLLAAGCGDDPEDNGEDDSGIDDSAVISELEEDEVSDLCDELTVGELSDDTRCAVTMMGVAAFQDEPEQYCEDNWDDCLNQEGDFEPEENGEDGDEEAECTLEEMDRSECTAEVGALRDCADEQVSGAETLGGQFECPDVEEPSEEVEQAMDDMGGQGDACQAFAEDCEDFFGDEGQEE